MSAFTDHLLASGVSLSPLDQSGRTATLEWDTQITGPVLGEQILVAIPDMHLSDGGPGDVFVGRGADQLARISRLLDGLASAKAAFPTTRVVQLGDLYDVWRAYPEYRDHPTSDYRRIEHAYGSVIGRLTQGLRARVCIGNHDAILGLYPPSWARTPTGPTGRLAYGHLLGVGRVLAFHGHQEAAVGEALAAQGGEDVVKIATLAAALWKAPSQMLQEELDLAAELLSDPEWSLAEMLARHWPFVDAPPGEHGYWSPAWCARNGRERLGRLASELPWASDLRMILVGHSHCPGISMTEVRGRLVPLVDAGSWIQGKSQIVVAEEGRLTLYAMT